MRGVAPTRVSGTVAGVLALGLLAGCNNGSTGSSSERPVGRKTGAAAGASTPAYSLPACPRLPRERPRPDGLPDLTLPCLGKGPAVRLSDLRGTPTVVNVWAAWCTNCAREMPLFSAAVRTAGHRVRFVGIHYKAPRAYALQSAADFDVPFFSVHDGGGASVVRALDAYAPPQTFFVTAGGRVAGRKVGEIRSERELRGLISDYLGVAL